MNTTGQNGIPSSASSSDLKSPKLGWLNKVRNMAVSRVRVIIAGPFQGAKSSFIFNTHSPYFSVPALNPSSAQVNLALSSLDNDEDVVLNASL